MLIVVALTIAAAAVVAAIASQSARSSSERSVGPLPSTEMAEIQATLTTWQDGLYPSLPADSAKAQSDGTTSVRYASFEALPASFVDQEHNEYAGAVSQVLDPTFAKTSGYGNQDPAAFIREQMSPQVVENDGLPVAWDLQVQNVEYRCTLANHDVVVWLHYWVGERRAFDVKSGVARRVRSVDQTPTDEYVLRTTVDGWRIVGMSSVDYGVDISPEYGPDTPHGHECTYTPQEVQGWAPGQTPDPGASVMPTVASPGGSASQ